MKVIQEKIDKEVFIDVVITLNQLDSISRGEMLSSEFYMGENLVYLGLRTPLPEEQDALKKR